MGFRVRYKFIYDRFISGNSCLTKTYGLMLWAIDEWYCLDSVVLGIHQDSQRYLGVHEALEMKFVSFLTRTVYP